MQHLNAAQTASVLRQEFRAKGRKHSLTAFILEHGIEPEVVVDGESRFMPPMVTWVAFRHDYRFTFQRHLTGPAVLHQVMVFPVFDAHLQWIDFVAVAPAINKAALFLGHTGMVGVRHLSSHTAKQGVRVYLDPMQYLQNGRQGILITNPAKAVHELRGRLLVANTIEHSRELVRFGLDASVIVVRK
jgi:hypothetical protein